MKKVFYKGSSIKSRLGGASTLFNAGKTTNFVYKLLGDVKKEDMDEINNIDGKKKIRDRMKAIAEKGFTLQFKNVAHEMFNLNLQVIDSRMPDILAALLDYFYNSKGAKLSELIQLIKEENPCNFNSALGHEFYEYKVKNFLRDVALGMIPSKKWDGLFDATGGYIVVREDGEVLCYHIYNHNELQEYLLKNTRFETASTSKYDYCKIYEVGGEYLFNLNLQIRFI